VKGRGRNLPRALLVILASWGSELTVCIRVSRRNMVNSQQAGMHNPPQEKLDGRRTRARAVANGRSVRPETWVGVERDRMPLAPRFHPPLSVSQPNLYCREEEALCRP